MIHRLVVVASIAWLGCGRGLAPPSGASPLVPYSASVCQSFTVPDESGIVLASVQGEYGAKQDLAFVRADGSVFIGATFGADRAAARDYIYISDIEVVVQDEYILAHRGADGVVLFDRRGVVIQRAPSREEMLPALVERQMWSMVDELDGWNVRGLPSGGQVPVDRWTDAEGRVLGWLDPATLEVRALEVASGIDTSQLIWTGDAFSGVVVRDGVASLVRISSNETRFSTIPGYAGEPHLQIKETKGRWAHLWSYEADREWIADLSSGDVRAITKKPPPGFQRFEPDALPGTSRLTFDLAEDGGLFGTFRDASSAGRFHSPDGSNNWVRLADPVTQVRYVSGWSQTGTQIVVALEPGAATNSPVAPWEPSTPGAAPLLAGTSTQLARGGVTRLLPRGSSLLSRGVSRSGLCAGYEDSDVEGRKRLSVLDVGTGATTHVDQIGPWGAVWIE